MNFYEKKYLKYKKKYLDLQKSLGGTGKPNADTQKTNEALHVQVPSKYFIDTENKVFVIEHPNGYRRLSNASLYTFPYTPTTVVEIKNNPDIYNRENMLKHNSIVAALELNKAEFNKTKTIKPKPCIKLNNGFIISYDNNNHDISDQIAVVNSVEYVNNDLLLSCQISINGISESLVFPSEINRYESVKCS